jgi:hypothetical protein
MTRQEFFEKLEQALLTRMTPAEITELLADFDEHFDAATRGGADEGAVCAMLGDPAEIAAQYLDGESDAPPPAAQSAPDLYISLFAASLFCRPHGGDDFSVKIYRNNELTDDPTITVSERDGRLEVVQERMDFISHLFYFHKRLTVYVDIPRRFSGEIYARLRYGNISVQDIPAARQLTCLMSSGNIKLSGVSAEAAHSLSATSGNLRMESCAGDVSAKLTSGNITILSHSGNVSAEVTSGNITVSTDRVTRDVRFKTVSGNLRFTAETLEAALEFSCVSGNTTLDIDKLAGNITGSATSGNITALFSRDTKAIFLSPSSGDRNDFASAVPKNAGVPVVSLSARHGEVRVKAR